MNNPFLSLKKYSSTDFVASGNFSVANVTVYGERALLSIFSLFWNDFVTNIYPWY